MTDHEIVRVKSWLNWPPEYQLQLDRGQALPPSWRGKHWACHRLPPRRQPATCFFSPIPTTPPCTTVFAARCSCIGGRTGRFADSLASPGSHRTGLRRFRTCHSNLKTLFSFLPLALAYRVRASALYPAANGRSRCLPARGLRSDRRLCSRLGIDAVNDIALVTSFIGHGLSWRMALAPAERPLPHVPELHPGL